MNDRSFGPLARGPFAVLVKRFASEEPMVDYMEKYLKVVFAVFLTATQDCAAKPLGPDSTSTSTGSNTSFSFWFHERSNRYPPSEL